MYLHGNGIPQDYVQAKGWLEKAAEQNIVGAQYNLGVMYKNGDGTHKNNSLAEKWFKKSCDNGDQNGCNEYNKISKR